MKTSRLAEKSKSFKFQRTSTNVFTIVIAIVKANITYLWGIVQAMQDVKHTVTFDRLAGIRRL